MAITIENIRVIYTDDIFLYALFGIDDEEEITLEDDMEDYIYDYIEDNIEDGTFADENDESIKSIREFQEVIREQLKEVKQVQVRYRKEI